MYSVFFTPVINNERISQEFSASKTNESNILDQLRKKWVYKTAIYAKRGRKLKMGLHLVLRQRYGPNVFNYTSQNETSMMPALEWSSYINGIVRNFLHFPTRNVFNFVHARTIRHLKPCVWGSVIHKMLISLKESVHMFFTLCAVGHGQNCFLFLWPKPLINVIYIFPFISCHIFFFK